MTLQTIFNYGALDSEAQIVIRREDREFDRNMEVASGGFVGACHNLKRIQEALHYKRPGFVEYCNSKPGLSWSTAQRMLQVAEMLPNLNNISIESKSALYLLASSSTPDAARAEALERAEAGESITYSEARTIINGYRNEELTGPVLRPAEMWDSDDDSGPVVLPITTRPEQPSEPQAEEWDRRPFPVADSDDYDGDEWYTPAPYIDAARATLGRIDLDPASCQSANEVVRAAAYFDKDDDGLAQEWCGRIFINPPYSNPLIARFTSKLIGEYDAGRVEAAILLVNNCTDAGWFHTLLQRFPVCFTRGRVGFLRPNQTAFATRQGQAIFYLGDDPATFARAFSAFGQVVTRWRWQRDDPQP